ncbi:transporter substrate-binding domain-containing protein [Stutzerimonas nitrititolerans]|uniref:transporter substrate-binding domain-containing protein n=1 Tax=Stutzerimonas nitrititolerans TaxID=2482751 RepID=UPI0028975D35|nr:transporter substrate-binding domain-containing protein [Stutzerimonas nitrititolerans]
MPTLFAALLFSAPCLAGSAVDERPTLTVGFSEFPPAIYSDAQGQAHGRLAEVTRRVLRQAGYQVSFRALPSARLYAGLKDGSIDLWPGAGGKPELAAHTLETRRSLSEVKLNLFHRHDTPPPSLSDGLAELTGRGVILIGGYDYWPRINRILNDPQHAIRLHHTASHLSGLRMLEHQRGDYLLGYEMPTEHARRQLDMAPLPSITIERVPIRFVISRYAPGSETLRDALDQAYEELMVAIPGWPLRGDTEAQPAASR